MLHAQCYTTKVCQFGKVSLNDQYYTKLAQVSNDVQDQWRQISFSPHLLVDRPLHQSSLFDDSLLAQVVSTGVA